MLGSSMLLLQAAWYFWTKLVTRMLNSRAAFDGSSQGRHPEHSVTQTSTTSKKATLDEPPAEWHPCGTEMFPTEVLQIMPPSLAHCQAFQRGYIFVDCQEVNRAYIWPCAECGVFGSPVTLELQMVCTLTSDAQEHLARHASNSTEDRDQLGKLALPRGCCGYPE